MRRGEDVERTQKRSNRRGPRHGGHQDVVLQTDAQFGRSIDDGQIFVKNREVELRYLIFSRHWLKFSLLARGPSAPPVVEVGLVWPFSAVPGPI